MGGLFSASALLSQTASNVVQFWRVSVPIISNRETALVLFFFLPMEICSFAGQELSTEMCLARLEPLITAVKKQLKITFVLISSVPLASLGANTHAQLPLVGPLVKSCSSSEQAAHTDEHPVIRDGEDPSVTSYTTYYFSPPFSQRRHGHQGIFCQNFLPGLLR